LWANLTFDWLATDRITYEIDLEPKAQVIVQSGEPTWTETKAIPYAEVAIAPWIDLLGEVDLAVRRESDDTTRVTLTPRIGVQLHILSRLMRPHAVERADREKPPKRRLDVGTLLRLEHMHVVSDPGGREGPWRFRDRFKAAYPLNRPRITSDGAFYVTSDGEVFVPVGKRTAPGGLLEELRLRSGIGYRRSFDWRFEVLYLWTAQRSESGAMAVRSHAIDLRVRRIL
jgi:hypothetical protein